MSVLHRMRHIESLNQVLKYNGSFAIHSVHLGLFVAARILRKGFRPPAVANYQVQVAIVPVCNTVSLLPKLQYYTIYSGRIV
jgi:hypothetical protein